MPTRQRLIRIQRKILEGLKEEIRSYMGRVTPALSRYYKDYEKDFVSYQSVSSKKDLLRHILKSQIVFSGDYHTFVQSQRIPLRILREVVKKKKEIVIGVEMVMSDHQIALDQYLLGHITETEFLEDIEYERYWGFNWDHFKPIFDFAKTHKIKMLALNCKPKKFLNQGVSELAHRDRWAAKIISEQITKDPKKLLYVIFGDLHLAKNHLPLMVEKKISKRKNKIKTLTIHQNNEKLYWQLVKKKIEHRVDIVKLKSNVYCITNAPPWIKLQSYMQWLEKPEHYDQVYESIKILSHFFKIPTQKLTDYHVYTSDQKNYTKRIISHFKDIKKTSSRIKKILSTAESCFIPGPNIIFLRQYSQNHAAEESTILMYATQVAYKHYPENAEAFFYENIFLKALGFMGSKVINPKRRCSREKDFKKNKMQKVAKGTLIFLAREKKFLKGHKFNATLPASVKISSSDIFEVSKNIGHRLGEKLYYALHNEYVSHKEICKLFKVKLSLHRAIEQYLFWLRKLEGINTHYQSKTERL